jgi:hypothetical protein
MALTVAKLCIWRCDFKRNWHVRLPSEKDKDGFDVRFVKDREKYFMSPGKDTNGDKLPRYFCDEAMPMYTTYIVDCFYSGVAMERLQVIDVHPGPESVPPYFHWYQDFIHEDTSERPFKRMNAEALYGNLNWNSRVIVMDLLLLFAKDVRKETNDILRKLFPVKIVSKDYPDLPAHSALHIFFVHFWQPAFKKFCTVFPPDAKSDEENDLGFAIGEICHVLGITCRTQWMQIGFFHKKNFDSYGDNQTHKHEYLPCRCERLLQTDILPRDCLRKFVGELADVFTRLKKHYLRVEVKISDIENPPPDHALNDDQKCVLGGDLAPGQECWKCRLNLQASYQKDTRHFVIAEEGFKALRKNGINSCEDPRTKNVYLFALLDVS